MCRTALMRAATVRGARDPTNPEDNLGIWSIPSKNLAYYLPRDSGDEASPVFFPLKTGFYFQCSTTKYFQFARFHDHLKYFCEPLFFHFSFISSFHHEGNNLPVSQEPISRLLVLHKFVSWDRISSLFMRLTRALQNALKLLLKIE